MKASEFDKQFDEGEDITMHLDLTSVRRPMQEARRVDVDFPAFPHIAYRRPINGRPTPVMQANGIRVQTLVLAATRWNMDPEDIAKEYGLPAASIKEALAFYDAHRDEVDALIAADEDAETRNA